VKWWSGSDVRGPRVEAERGSHPVASAERRRAVEDAVGRDERRLRADAFGGHEVVEDRETGSVDVDAEDHAASGETALGGRAVEMSAELEERLERKRAVPSAEVAHRDELVLLIHAENRPEVVLAASGRDPVEHSALSAALQQDQRSVRRRALSIAASHGRDERLEDSQVAGRIEPIDVAPAGGAVHRGAVEGAVGSEQQGRMRIRPVDPLEPIHGIEDAACVHPEQGADASDRRAGEVAVRELDDSSLRVGTLVGNEAVDDLEALGDRCRGREGGRQDQASQRVDGGSRRHANLLSLDALTVTERRSARVMQAHQPDRRSDRLRASSA
jgi:hypothetical protein